MGSCVSTENVDARKLNAEAENEMRKAKRQMRKEAKILLLGSGDSGKTTMMKQMRLITDGSFTKGELESYRQLVFTNLISGMKALVECLSEVGLSIEDDQKAQEAYRVILISVPEMKPAVESAPDVKDGQPFPEEYLPLFKLLWERPAIREGLDHCRRFAIPDNVQYFYPQLDRLWAPDYSPTNQDIVQTRARTVGIVETAFKIPNSFPNTVIPDPSARAVTAVQKRARHASAGVALSPEMTSIMSEESSIAEVEREKSRGKFQLRSTTGPREFRFVDVGGQRSERRKWIHCFQDVTSILFMVSLSGYDQCMVEERSTNQMSDAMTIWEGICKMEWFKDTSFLLFLNKEDLFRKKIAQSPIRRFFPDYEGADDDVEAGKTYFQKRFLRIEYKGSSQLQQLAKASSRQSQNRSPYPNNLRHVYPHFTTAVNTSLILDVMGAVTDTILRGQLRNADML